MRILILNQYFDPDVAASAQRLTELSEDLAARHDLVVVAGRPSYDPVAGKRRERPPRLRVRRVLSTAFRRHRTAGRVLNYLSYLASAFTVSLLGRRPHLVIAATDPPLVGFVGQLVSALWRVPLVHLLWDVQPQVALAAGLLRPGLAASVIDSLSRRSLRSAAAVIVPTEEMKKSAIACGAAADRVTVVPLWEDTAIIAPQPRDNPFSREHGLVDRFVVMYSGNIGLTQSLEVMLDAGERMREVKELELLFIGDGAARRSLQAEAERRQLPNVRFLPYQRRDEMSLSLAAADVFLVSLRPGLTKFMHPSKVFTIMASGRPVVAALDSASDTAQLIEREGFGFVVAPGDADGIERHLRWLHGHPEERLEMGRRARRAAELHYARTVVTPRYLELLRQFERPAGHPAAAIAHPDGSRR
jgi:glycosyltransferase involved in cell wall biosynthesis